MEEQVFAIKEIIKEEIRKKYGHKIQYAKDCQILAESILKNTNRQISVSTLKRFFGIINTPFNPSKYTLDTLAAYLNFKNWQDYVRNFEDNKHIYSSLNSWEQLKKRMEYITSHCMQSIGAKIGKEILHLPPREFAVRKMDSFLQSSKVATAFIAPGGYGKSTLVYQLAEHYFTGDEAKNPNDIVMLIDGSSLVTITNTFSENDRLRNLMDFDQKNSFSNYFRDMPNEVKGRFIIIIDGLNEIFYQTEKLTKFVENLLDIITSYENIPWFKLIITCHPDNWKIFTGIAQKTPSIKKQWFDVSFNGLANETINVPLLEKREIKMILEKRNSPQLFQQLKFRSPQIAELINHPYFLNLFMDKSGENFNTDIDLLDHFIYHHVLSDPFSAEKSKIIESIFLRSEYGKKIIPVQKEDLPLSDEYIPAYKKLIAENIIYEYTIPGVYFSVSTYVRFSNDILMEFMLANKWLQENTLDLELIKKISNYYANNRKLRCNLISYILRIAFKESKLDLLRDIYSIFARGNGNSIMINMCDVDPETINVINIELRKHGEIRDYLIPYYAKSKSGQRFYFETFFDMDSLVLHAGDNVNYYLENKPSKDAQIYGHHLKFTRYFFENDAENLTKEFLWFKNIKQPDQLVPLTAGFYYAAMIIYQSAINKRFNDETWATILHLSDRFYKEEAQAYNNFPIFEYLIVNALNYANRFAEIREIIKLVLKRYVLTEHASSWLYQLFMAFYSRALFNSGDEEQGVEIFNRVKFKSIPINYNYYVKLRYYMIQAEFLLYENKIHQAHKLLMDVKSISRMIRFKYFYVMAASYEKALKTGTPHTPDTHFGKNLNAL